MKVQLIQNLKNLSTHVSNNVVRLLLPDEMVDIIRKDLEKFDDMAQDGLVGDNNNSKKAIRESKIVWINENHWVSFF